ncbi:lysophospholipid acyltransferase family protein [Fimbriiglobus ruber]|uniref:lysophospholipid acyltransferase family protein n=1 Tax=Fimbriiglobus ruber TaxID=1908690 RepID=UPI000B4A5B33|nr:lysophospholipid acyltransferase family protein [Fimbriiglobus ruber]
MQKWDLQPARDLGMPVGEQLRSLRRENGLVSTGLHMAWWSLVRGYLAVWHRLAVSGQQNLPAQPPFILVANHTSHLDALVLAASLPVSLWDRTFPIAAGDVFFQTTLVSAFAAGALNALPMWRKKCGPRALGQLRQRLLEDPCVYILFPEGTRSRDGQLSAFKPGLGMLVAETNVPVIPCYLEGCHRAFAAGQLWPQPRRIHLRIGEPLTFAAVADNREGWLHIAATMEERVRALASGPTQTASQGVTQSSPFHTDLR